jgi:UDP-N-acetylmuramoylalanine-D-glutamate ligase
MMVSPFFTTLLTNLGLAGNIGKSLALQVAETPHKYYVIELSSFQLDNMYEFRANVAILLNITPDHLDRYEFKMQNYTDAKMRITQNQDSWQRQGNQAESHAGNTGQEGFHLYHRIELIYIIRCKYIKILNMKLQ